MALNTTLLMNLNSAAYHAAQGHGKDWDASYERELDSRGLCILGLSETSAIVISRSFELAMPGPFKNPHGEWCECGGRGITFKEYCADHQPQQERAMSERQIEVQLETGRLVMCPVVGAGQFCLEVEHNGERFVAEHKLGAWREIPDTREPADWSRSK